RPMPLLLPEGEGRGEGEGDNQKNRTVQICYAHRATCKKSWLLCGPASLQSNILFVGAELDAGAFFVCLQFQFQPVNSSTGLAGVGEIGVAFDDLFERLSNCIV